MMPTSPNSKQLRRGTCPDLSKSSSLPTVRCSAESFSKIFLLSLSVGTEWCLEIVELAAIQTITQNSCVYLFFSFFLQIENFKLGLILGLVLGTNGDAFSSIEWVERLLELKNLHLNRGNTSMQSFP